MDVKQAATGRWPDLLKMLGVDEAFLTGRNGPCPMCGGRDRWRFTDHERAGMWICNQCGAGDGFKLLQEIHGWSFREAKKAVGELIPEATFTKPDRDRGEKARRSLNRVHAEAVHASKVPEVVRYLEGRNLIVPPGLQAHKSLPYYVDGEAIARYPAMLGKAVSKDGRPITLHRTYVRDGKKAPVDSPRKLMRPASKESGYAIRLWPANEVVAICEGIESSIAFAMLYRVPTWSVISADGMVKFQPPQGIRTIMIAGDNDESFTGQAASYEAAKRLASQGYHVTVEIPPKIGDDWNDYLLSEKQEDRNAAA